MKSFKEIRKIDISNLRNYCIRKDLYSNGTESEYNQLFNMARKANKKSVTLKTYEKLASDILKHSDYESMLNSYGCDFDELIANTMYELITDCSYSYIEVVEK